MNFGQFGFPEGPPGKLLVVPRYTPAKWPAKYAWLGSIDAGGQRGPMISVAAPSSQTWQGMASDGVNNVVVISSGGATALSRDGGKSFVAGGALPAGTWRSLFYGGGLFVALNSDGVNPSVATSPDGAVWTQRAGSPSLNMFCGAWQNGVYVICTSAGVPYTSPDAIVWTARAAGTCPGSNFWRLVLTGQGLFVFVGFDAGTNIVIWTSPDGITYTSRIALAAAIQMGGPTGGAYGNGVFALYGPSASNVDKTLTSADAINWRYAGSPFNVTGGTTAQNSIAFANGIFAFACTAGLYTCTDGVNWRAPMNYPGAITTQVPFAITASLDRFITAFGQAAQSTFFTTDPTAQDLIYAPSI